MEHRMGLTNAQFATLTDLSRFAKKFKILSGGCWEWIGSLTQSHPTHLYGHFSFQGRPVLATRFIYEAFNGSIPPGLVLDHLCRNTRCVNLKHLEAVTQQVNCMRGNVPIANHPLRAKCRNNHPLTGENIIVPAINDHRRCKICHQRQRKAYRKEHYERTKK